MDYRITYQKRAGGFLTSRRRYRREVAESVAATQLATLPFLAAALLKPVRPRRRDARAEV
jgi:hypothetical protein